jgi:hypothetical protein
MAELQNSRIAELLFTELPLCDFARTISEIAALLTRICGDQCKISWDYDDVASFDMPGTRILLSYSDSPYQKFTARLVLSVGPSGVSPLAGQSVMVHTALCAKMVARLQQRCAPDEVRWRNITGVVTAEEIDKLVEAPPSKATAHKKHQPNICNPHQSSQHSAELHPLRQALRPHGFGADLPDAAFRLASQTIDLASSVVLLPFAAVHYASSLFYRSYQTAD